MVLIGFGCFSSFWVSLVVLALVGMSGKRKIFGCHWFFANFWICFVIVATAPFCFSGVPGISNTPRIISPLRKAHKMALNLALSCKFSQLCVRPPISSIFLSCPSKKLPLAIVGMGGKCVGFICFLTILANFWANLVISCPLSFLRGTRHLQYP